MQPHCMKIFGLESKRKNGQVFTVTFSYCSSCYLFYRLTIYAPQVLYISFLWQCAIIVFYFSDLHHVDAGPDLSFHFDADPNPIYRFDTGKDPNPAPHQSNRIL